MQLKRVVVTGMGVLSSIGNNIPDYWESLRNGVSGADWITRFDASLFKTRFACEVKNLDTSAYFDRKEIRKCDLYTQFAIIAADEAVKDSKLLDSQTDLTRAGVVFASGIGGLTTFTSEIKDFVEGGLTPRFSPFFIPKMISNMASGLISIRFGFKGPSFATVSACASSTNAIIDGFTYIQTGRADVFLCGGSEAAVTEPGVGGFNSMQALSTANDHYKEACCPFDKNRDGFVIGEGAGALVLEEYEHAIARGAKIYAELVGVGMSSDAYHFTAPHPEGEGACRVMRQAIEDANLKPQDIDYINVHGTSTPLGDIAEAKAIVQVFGEYAPKLSISSTKSMTGHLLGATGAIEAIACVLALCNGTVPPTINHHTDDPDIDFGLDFTFNQAKKRDLHYALSNTFGFGGQNASVIFKKFDLQ